MNQDLISRQAAIDCVNHVRFGMDEMAFGIATTALLELPSAQPEQIARDIATIIENEQDMRVLLKNTERTETHECDYKRTETHDSRREWYMKGYRDAQPRWISVEEALPEDDKRVLCQMKGGELVFGFHHGKYWAYGHKPIAWFPLPEPYAERRQDGQTNR